MSRILRWVCRWGFFLFFPGTINFILHKLPHWSLTLFKDSVIYILQISLAPPPKTPWVHFKIQLTIDVHTYHWLIAWTVFEFCTSEILKETILYDSAWDSMACSSVAFSCLNFPVLMMFYLTYVLPVNKTQENADLLARYREPHHWIGSVVDA